MQFYCQNMIRWRKILNYAYMLKNGVGRYITTTFLNFYTKLAESSFLCHFHVESVNVFVLPRFDFCTSDIFFINKQFRTCTNAFPNEFTVRSYEYWVGQHWILFWMEENQTAMYFLRSRLRVFTMILWKIQLQFISIKHRILATFNINKKFNSDNLYVVNQYTKILAYLFCWNRYHVISVCDVSH